jgi:8-amino-7-oxononanoate synthase
MSGFDELAGSLAALDARHMYRRRRVVEGPTGREVSIDGRRLVNFCSNDYLGLAADPRVRAALHAGVDRWGAGAGASHLVCGHSAAHRALETALATWAQRPRALLFSNGYAANLGVINALLGRRDAIFEDRLNHASLIDGGRLCGAAFHWYPHADSSALDELLAGHAGGEGRRLIVTDGTFSMDGDLCPLDALVAVARRHDAWLLVDDAHGCGVHGRAGRGVVDPAVHGVADVPVLVGTLGKAFGTFGAFVAGSEVLIETLIQRSRNYIYTTALPAAIAEATLVSLDIATGESWRREHIDALVRRFRDGAARLGLKLLPSTTPIQPLLIGEPGAALAISAALESHGYLVTPIRPPTVPPGTARLRITLTAAHQPEDVDGLLAALGDSVPRAMTAGQAS